MDNLTYFILTRKIFESAIWRDDPHILKLFIYLIGMARHQKYPKKYPGFDVKRGELITSLSNISENNEFIKNGRLQSWGRSKVSRMLKVLIEQGYIQVLSDTYGTHISICNYDTYQSPDTYKPNTTETQLKRSWDDTETELGTFNKDNNGNKDNNYEDKGTPPVPKPEFDYNYYFNAWNDFAERFGLGKIKALSDTRKANVRQRSQESEFNLKEILKSISESEFLKGSNPRGWKVDFDFVFASKNNYLKILENKYKTVYGKPTDAKAGRIAREVTAMEELLRNVTAEQ